MPPLPEMTPAKLLSPPTPVLSVWVDRPTVPLPDRLPRVCAPPSCRWAVAPTSTAGCMPSRSADDRMKLPVLTATVLACEVPAKVPPLLTVIVPPPRLALAVPPSKVVLLALKVPVPASVPASVSALTLLSPAVLSVAPLATVTAAPAASRLALPSVRLVPLTSTVVAAAVPLSWLDWLDVSVPVPRLASAVPPLSV